MKTIPQLSKTIFALLLIAITFSCTKDNDTVEKEESIQVELHELVKLIKENEELSSFVNVLELINEEVLVQLNSTEQKTVFVPTNNAFESLFSSLEGYSSLSDFDSLEKKIILAKIVKHHIINGEALMSKDLSTGIKLVTESKEEFSITIDGDIFITDETAALAKIIKKDQQAINGVVHVIDEILVPESVLSQLITEKSILELVSENSELSLLNEAIAKAGLTNALSTDGPFTVLAPSNAAIEQLFNLLGDNFNSFNDFNGLVEIEILKRILLYHVAQGKMTINELPVGSLPTLLEGDTVEVIDSGTGFVFGDASEINANLVLENIEASNGIIHVIDKILIPAEVQEFLDSINVVNKKSLKELVEENENFSFLKRALTITGLLGTLDQDGPLTVFVPSNESFSGLLPLLGGALTTIEDFDTIAEINLLRDILLYHIHNGELLSADLLPGDVTTLSGENKLKVVSTQEGYGLVDATKLAADILVADVKAKNGIIHTIDRVLLPQSIIDDLASQANKVLADVLAEIDDLDEAYKLFLSLGGSLQNALENEFTFFFPTNTAFVELFKSIEGYDSLADFNTAKDIEILKTIIKYHCVESGKLLSSQLTNEQILTTAQGETLQIVLNNGTYLVDKTGLPAKVKTADKEVLKGVIHIVDKVLLPQELIEKL
ncbi:fasciclin domain-containing protein [uncultured Maribacter sp.]|uniref:fasciclin domain-containing protein n=1 Tax=uncultured Maribacter sp. TaxID=431308 RepID=UPI0026173A01|nr:fasciclin domain-containing protein [uncultured Maribacter sp.]